MDATFLRKRERAAFRSLAARLGVPFAIVSCRAPESVLRARVAARSSEARDASEATLDVLEAQLRSQEALDTDEGHDVILADTEAPGNAAFVAERPAFATCAGLILLATALTDGGRVPFPPLAALDVEVSRNAYGRQVDSFEADLDVEGVEHPVRGVFIRAPVVEDVGEGVRVLAELEGRPVVLEQGNLVVASFHPELVGETGLHGYLLRKA